MMKYMALAAAVACLGIASTANAGDWSTNNWGGGQNWANSFNFEGNVGVMNEGHAVGDYGKVKSSSWKMLEGEGGANAPGGAWAKVRVGAGTYGEAFSFSGGNGHQTAATRELGSILGNGKASVSRD